MITDQVATMFWAMFVVSADKVEQLKKRLNVVLLLSNQLY